MITVEWFCHDTKCNRTGKLLQICAGRTDNGDEDIAFVIVERLKDDHSYAHLQGTLFGSNMKIIKRVRANYLVV